MSYSCIPVGWIAEDSKLKKKTPVRERPPPCISLRTQPEPRREKVMKVVPLIRV